MWGKVLDSLAVYGFPGVMLAITLGYIFYQSSEQRKERKEWLDSDEKKSTKMTTAVDNNTALLNEIKGLFQGYLHNK